MNQDLQRPWRTWYRSNLNILTTDTQYMKYIKKNRNAKEKYHRKHVSINSRQHAIILRIHTRIFHDIFRYYFSFSLNNHKLNVDDAPFLSRNNVYVTSM